MIHLRDYQEEAIKQLQAELGIFKDYLHRNGYGLQLHDIEKEIKQAIKETK